MSFFDTFVQDAKAGRAGARRKRISGSRVRRVFWSYNIMAWYVVYVVLVLIVVAGIMAWQFHSAPANAVVSFLGCTLGIVFISGLSFYRQKGKSPYDELLQYKNIVQKQINTMINTNIVNIEDVIIQNIKEILYTQAKEFYDPMQEICEYYYNFTYVSNNNNQYANWNYYVEKRTELKTHLDYFKNGLGIPNDANWRSINNPSRIFDDLYVMINSLKFFVGNMQTTSAINTGIIMLKCVQKIFSRYSKEYLHSNLKKDDLFVLGALYVVNTSHYIDYLTNERNTMDNKIRIAINRYVANFTGAYFPYVPDEFYKDLEAYLYDKKHNNKIKNQFIDMFARKYKEKAKTEYGFEIMGEKYKDIEMTYYYLIHFIKMTNDFNLLKYIFRNRENLMRMLLDLRKIEVGVE
jgi:hypothetical protein